MRIMKKFTFAFLLCLLLCILLPVFAGAQETDDDLQERLEQLDTQEWQRYIDGLGEEYRQIGEWDSVGDLLQKILSNQLDLSYDTLWGNISGIFISQLKELLPMLLQLTALVLIYSLLKNLSLLKGKTEELAFLGGNIIMIMILYNCFFGMLTSVREMISQINGFTELLLPPMTALLASAGAAGGAGALQPAGAMVTGGLGMLLQNIILPLVILWSVVLLIGQLSKHIKLGEMSGFLKSCINWGLGVSFTVLAGVIAIQGLSAAAYDGVSIRAIKYAISTGVPVIGGMVGESVNMVLSCSILIKSAIGILGLLVICGMLLGPCIKIVSMILILKGFSAITAPFADEGLAGCVKGIADAFKILAVTLFGVGLVYFLIFGIAIGAGSSLL